MWFVQSLYDCHVRRVGKINYGEFRTPEPAQESAILLDGDAFGSGNAGAYFRYEKGIFRV
ncbi:conserved domain protein [delta proteobacterium NaphS2]|nr:conserved domain protein [delta proteobacterium NaphS2]